MYWNVLLGNGWVWCCLVVMWILMFCCGVWYELLWLGGYFGLVVVFVYFVGGLVVWGDGLDCLDW